MPDNPFAVFGLDPAPALDGEALKEQFARLTAEQHPDKFQQAADAERAEADARYAALNRAFQTLVDPRARLLALYELTKGEKPRDVQRIPPGTMDLFVEVGQACRLLDEFLERKRAATGRLEKAGLAGEELTLQDTLMMLGGKLAALGTALEDDLAKLDIRWRMGEHDLVALETAYRKYSYLARWRQQLEEREIALLTGE
jgi:curved DNA-binding protein CbpA